MPCCVPRCVPEATGAVRQLVRFPKDYRLRRRWKEVIKQATGIELVESARFEPGDDDPAPLELCIGHMARPEATEQYQEPARFVDSSGAPLTLLGCRLCLQFFPAHETLATDGAQVGGLSLVASVQRLFGIRIRPDDFQRAMCLGCLAKLELVQTVRNQYRVNEFVYETVRKASRIRLEVVGDEGLEIVAEEVDVGALGDEFGEGLLEELGTHVGPMASVGKRRKEGTKGKTLKKTSVVEEVVPVAAAEKPKDGEDEDEFKSDLFEELEMVDNLEESSLEDDHNDEVEVEPVPVAEKEKKPKKDGSARKKTSEETKPKDKVKLTLVLSTTCFICNGTFSSRGELEMHLSMEHISEDGYTCAECDDGERFVMVQTYNLHLSHHDHSIRRFKCSFCTMAFSVRNSRRLHENKKHGQSHKIRERNISESACDICGKTFAHQGNVLRHKKKEHEQFKGHKCKICERELTTRVSLLQHMLIHSDKRQCPYTCCHCEKRFRYISQLHTHKLKHHQAVMNDYLCFVCQSRFTSIADYESHMRELHVHHESYEYSCRLCPEIPQTDQELESHITTAHASAKYPYFKCSSCPSKFHTKNQLFQHRKIDHGRFVCDRCGSCYSSKMGLQQHIDGKHLGKQWPRSKVAQTPCKCQECGLVCSNVANMRRHQKAVHQGEKPYECASCGARFATKSSMQNHVRCTHTGEAPFSCKHCGERFKETSIFSRHQKKCGLEGPKSGDGE
ncbi:hypothetical protein pipiens_015359 [Culex pipiens pipiens]|uniref:Zinc finger protein n=1 Tax=Culex pipiens pipiens TaxID=38569 RepID=A0ABD1CQZ7_CULPP